MQGSEVRKVTALVAALVGAFMLVAGGAARADTPWWCVSGEVISDRQCEDCGRMTVVPAGDYMMGSSNAADREKPQHRVTFRKPFAVGVHEVTFAEWDACVAGGGCDGYRPDDEGEGRGPRPVFNVNFDDAMTYVRWLSQKTGQEYRLLSEAEWEYVARAGTTTEWHWGDSESDLCRHANGRDPVCDDEYYYSAPVGSFLPNDWGLHDVAGNVNEWTADCANDSYHGAPSDGSAWESGNCQYRVVRGGASYNQQYASDMRSANRWAWKRDTRQATTGFRVALTLPGCPDA